jgi:hypothetical protein
MCACAHVHNPPNQPPLPTHPPVTGSACTHACTRPQPPRGAPRLRPLLCAGLARRWRSCWAACCTWGCAAWCCACPTRTWRSRRVRGGRAGWTGGAGGRTYGWAHVSPKPPHPPSFHMHAHSRTHIRTPCLWPCAAGAAQCRHTHARHARTVAGSDGNIVLPPWARKAAAEGGWRQRPGGGGGSGGAGGGSSAQGGSRGGTPDGPLQAPHGGAAAGGAPTSPPGGGRGDHGADVPLFYAAGSMSSGSGKPEVMERARAVFASGQVGVLAGGARGPGPPPPHTYAPPHGPPGFKGFRVSGF